MRAFTLIETLITILIFSLVLWAVFSLIIKFYQDYHYIFTQSIAVEEARRGVETMIREIREACFGDDGSYPIELAGEKEFIFYSDIDKDGDTERVRYFLGGVGSTRLSQECVVFSKGGSCIVNFSNFLSGELESAEVKVSVEGDFGMNQEYAEIYADSQFLGRICQTNCSDCAGIWQGDQVFDVTDLANDNSIQFLADATNQVDAFCDWQEPNHSMKVSFEFSFTETVSGAETDFRKGIINPVGTPIEYPLAQEEIITLSFYVRNSPPIFEYFDENGEKIIDYPARLKDTKMIKLLLIVDVDLNREPPAFELESWTQLRNLKNEL